MADATVVNYGGPERNLRLALGDKVLHRWSLTADDADTHDTGLENIVEVAITGTRAVSEVGLNTISHASGDCSISGVVDGVVTFSAAGLTLFDLLVWSDK